MIFEWIFDVKMGGLEGWKRVFRLILVAKYDVSVFRKKASKRRAKSHPKWGKNRALGAQGSDFWDFGRFCERSDFRWIVVAGRYRRTPKDSGYFRTGVWGWYWLMLADAGWCWLRSAETGCGISKRNFAEINRQSWTIRQKSLKLMFKGGQRETKMVPGSASGGPGKFSKKN